MFLTKEEISHITPDVYVDYMFEEDDNGHEYVSVGLLGLSWGVGERLFGISLDSEKYSDAWIDVYADLKPNRDSLSRSAGYCDRLYFNLVANTGDSQDNRDVYICPTNAHEQEQIFDQIVSCDSEIAEMIKNCK